MKFSWAQRITCSNSSEYIKTYQAIDMHLRLDLLSVLFLGISCFAINHFIGEWKSRIRRQKREVRAQSNKKRKRSHIEKDLDYLLLQYNQGLLSEQQYHQMTNSLIDKLIELDASVIDR